MAGILSADTPDYLPSAAYFARLAAADCFYLADDLRYISQRRINRTMVGSGDQSSWLSVPVLSRGRQHQSIRQACISGDPAWRRKHWRRLVDSYAFTPFFDYYGDFFESLYQRQWTSLIELNRSAIDFICTSLAIDTPLKCCSDLALSSGAEARIIDLLAIGGQSGYLADPQLHSFLKSDLFVVKKRELLYIDFEIPERRFASKRIDLQLSVIDLLFQMGPETGAFLREITRLRVA